MELYERVHREVPEEERQNVRDAIAECDDLELLRRLALGDAAGWSWRMAAMERLAQIEPNHETKEALIAALRQVAEQGVLPIKRIAQARLSQIDRLDPSAGPETWGKTVFNPRLARYLHKHKSELDFESGYDLDLVEYAVCNRDDNFSSVDRRIAGVLYNLLPQERKDRVDGKVREYLGWHPSAGRYFLLKRLVEAETDADLLEDAVLAAKGWPASFAFARLSGWSTYQEEDYWSFLTFECERLAGYPKERLEALTKRMIERGLLDE